MPVWQETVGTLIGIAELNQMVTASGPYSRQLLGTAFAAFAHSLTKHPITVYIGSPNSGYIHNNNLANQ